MNGDSTATSFARTGDAVGFPRSREAHRRHAAELATAAPKGDEYRWIVETLAGEFAGTLNTFDCDHRSGTFNHGVAITRSNWHKGFATEASRLVLAFYFRDSVIRKRRFIFTTSTIAHCACTRGWASGSRAVCGGWATQREDTSTGS